MRYLIILCLMLLVCVAFSQEKETVNKIYIVRIIHLDYADAAMIATLFGGTVIPRYSGGQSSLGGYSVSFGGGNIGGNRQQNWGNRRRGQR